MVRDAQIGVVGGGPAGSRAAELLSKAGADVVLFDPKAPWEKPCGGAMTAAAFEAFPELAELMPDCQTIRTVRLEAGETRVELPLERPIQILSRLTLGAWQLERARQAGAVVSSQAIRGIHRLPDGGWQLETDTGDRVIVELLVGADGAASRVRRAVAPSLRIELAPTRVAYPCGSGSTPNALGLRFFPRLDGYAWDFPRPGHRSIGVGVAPGTWDRGRMDQEVDAYREERGGCSCDPPPRAGAVIGTAARPLGRSYALLGRADYALLGDAAGFADPATGEGIQNALRSADLLAEAFSLDGTFRAYPRLAEARLEQEFVQARRIKRLLYTHSFAARLVRLAARFRLAYTVAAVLVNGGNGHERAILPRLRTEWSRSRSRITAGR